MEINYVVGDATQPVGEGPKLIVHVCNDIGAWGADLSCTLEALARDGAALSRLAFWRGGKPFALGEVQFVQVANALWVANLIGQRGIRTIGGIPPVRYEAVRKGLRNIAAEAERLGGSVHLRASAVALPAASGK